MPTFRPSFAISSFAVVTALAGTALAAEPTWGPSGLVLSSPATSYARASSVDAPAFDAAVAGPTRVRSPGLIIGGIALTTGGAATTLFGAGLGLAGGFVGQSCSGGCSGTSTLVVSLGVSTGLMGIAGIVTGIYMIRQGSQRVPALDRAAKRSAFTPSLRPDGIAFHF